MFTDGGAVCPAGGWGAEGFQGPGARNAGSNPEALGVTEALGAATSEDTEALGGGATTAEESAAEATAEGACDGVGEGTDIPAVAAGPGGA